MRWFKELGKTILGSGVVVPILRGPLAGMRYRMNRYSGFAAAFGGWERDSQRIFQAFVQPGSVIYDLGANTGIHSMHFSKLVRNSGTVYAFEPMPCNLSELEIIKAKNAIANLHIVAKAVSNKAGQADFSVANHAKQGSLVEGGGKVETITVDITTLDLMVQNGVKLPDFIKIDIEGAEGVALEGAIESVRQSCPTMYIELHNPDQDILVGRFLAQTGYEVFRVRTPDAVKLSQQVNFLQRIDRLDLGYPHPEGVYGALVAVHPTRQSQWQQAINELSSIV
jgi:FkbM family methyltransferase